MAPTPTELQRLATVISRRTGMALPSTRLPFLTARARAVMAWGGARRGPPWRLRATVGGQRASALSRALLRAGRTGLHRAARAARDGALPPPRHPARALSRKVRRHLLLQRLLVLHASDQGPDPHPAHRGASPRRLSLPRPRRGRDASRRQLPRDSPPVRRHVPEDPCVNAVPDRQFLVSVFLMEAWDTLGEIEDHAPALVAEGRVEPLLVLTHRLRGAAGLNGFPGVSAIASTMETIVQTSAPAPAAGRLPAAAALAGRVPDRQAALDRAAAG